MKHSGSRRRLLLKENKVVMSLPRSRSTVDPDRGTSVGRMCICSWNSGVDIGETCRCPLSEMQATRGWGIPRFYLVQVQYLRYSSNTRCYQDKHHVKKPHAPAPNSYAQITAYTMILIGILISYLA